MAIASMTTMAMTTGNIVVVNTHIAVSASFMGLGVQWDPFEYQPTPQNWRVILQRMAFCRPGYLRVMWSASSFCKGFRLDGSPEYVWQKGFASSREYLNKLCAILDFAQKQKIRVLLGEWSPPFSLIKSETDRRWARMTADLLEYLRNKRGYTCIRLYNVINEPNGGWSGNKDYGTWVNVVKNLHRELVKRGLSQAVRIIGPDTTGNSNWLEPFTWLDRAAKDLPDDIGAWDLHWYALDSEVYNDEIEQLLKQKRQMLQQDGGIVAAKPLFLGESGLLTGRINGDQQPGVKTFNYGVMMADYAAQTMRAGWMGATAWDLDDAMHTVNGHQTPPGPLTLKVWGFWNSQGAAMGHPEDFNIRPWFYTWSLMSRFFSRGSRIVETSEPAFPRFRAAASTDRRHGREILSVMLVNNDQARRTIILRVPSARRPVTLTCYRYFKTVRPTDRNGFPVPFSIIKNANLRKGLQVTLPSRGVVFLTEANK